MQTDQEPVHSSTFTDGLGIKPQNAMSPEYASGALGYLQYKRPDGLIDPEHVLVGTANWSVSVLQKAFAWVNHELKGGDLALNFMLDDTPTVFAQCDPVKTEVNREATIYVGLGFIPILVGITNRLLHMQRSGPIGLEMEMQGKRHMQTPEDTWHPINNPVGILMYDYVHDRNTTTSTADSLLLIFFHEIAHALRGHLWSQPPHGISDHHHRRALESDADWCAGYLFVKYELNTISKSESLTQEYVTVLCERLAVASASLNCALQVERKTDSDHYHLPYTRSQDNFSGAGLAWRESELPYNFSDLTNEAYGQLALLDYILAHRLDSWIGYNDPRNTSDKVEKRDITQPILKKIHEDLLEHERGPVVGARSLWLSLLPKPSFRPRSNYSVKRYHFI